jgi:tRNA-Thr(GGU) m(6)t(6)A37 methyltransferase TsaA
MDFTYHPIGLIRSLHHQPDKTPIQPVFSMGCQGEVEIFEEYEPGLSDIEGFSHIILLYHFHQAKAAELRVKPFLQDQERGIFATCAPLRPNPIGFSVVELIKRQGCVLMVNGLDIIDQTPLLDIKPYITRFDCLQTKKDGWQEEVDDKTVIFLGSRGKR